MNQDLSSLSVSVHALTTQMQQLRLELPSAPAVPGPFHQTQPPAREPRLPTPQPYDGEPGTCRSFLSQCSLTLELQDSAFPTEHLRVAYVITLLTSKTREWGTALWDSNAIVCANFKDFTDEMRQVFDRAVCGRDAASMNMPLISALWQPCVDGQRPLHLTLS